MVLVNFLPLSDLAHHSEELLKSALSNPGPVTLALAFGGGGLTSLCPCYLALLPVTLPNFADLEEGKPPLAAQLGVL